MKEHAIMGTLDHPNIVKLFDTFKDNVHLHLVLELCEGGNLLDRIGETGCFSEREASVIMRQVFRATAYMHTNEICHRDLKHDNLMLSTKAPILKNTLKVIDFGKATFFQEGVPLKTMVGSHHYTAPEVRQKSYDHTIDLWSCGVIMYVLLLGYFPFDGPTYMDVLKNVAAGAKQIDKYDWEEISEGARELIDKLLVVYPRERSTAQQALHHAWMVNMRSLEPLLGASLLKRLQAMRSQNKLQRCARHIIARRMTEDQIRELRDAFEVLDVHGVGSISFPDMKAGFLKAGIQLPSDMDKVLHDLDKNGNGMLDFTEFISASLDEQLFFREEVCWEVFSVFDQKGDKRISMEELQYALKHENLAQIVGANACDEIMSEVDTNRDGYISFNEFMSMIRKSQLDGARKHQRAH